VFILDALGVEVGRIGLAVLRKDRIGAEAAKQRMGGVLDGVVAECEWTARWRGSVESVW
jgi:hypothetical protein